MMEKLDFLVRFWGLKARHDLAGEPLSAAEQIELLSLLQLVTPELNLPSAGPLARPNPIVTVDLIGAGRIVSAELRAVTAAALFVVSPVPVEAGASLVVRATDAVSGVELSLPCRVAWAFGGAPTSLALRVDGVPGRSSFATVPDAVPHLGMTRGARPALVG